MAPLVSSCSDGCVICSLALNDQLSALAFKRLSKEVAEHVGMKRPSGKTACSHENAKRPETP